MLTTLLLLFRFDQHQKIYAATTAIERAIEENGGKDDINSIYRVAISWYNSDEESKRVDSLAVLHKLADDNIHVMASFKLGNHYSDLKQPEIAVRYFALAGENGPHHAALYNAGRLMATLGNWVGSMAYFRAAATLANEYPKEYISDATTQTAVEAHAILSQSIVREELSIDQMADLFIYGSLENLGEEAEELWKTSVFGLIKFNQTLIESDSHSQSKEAMQTVTNALRVLWENYGTLGLLSNLQTYILLDIMNDMLGPLSRLDDAYVPMAAGYAEALAFHSKYCFEYFASNEEESACFNGAAASAMSFYRQLSDPDSANRVLQNAQKHPNAATHWKLTEQTPRVFHPKLTAKPWWNEGDFSAARSLSAACKKPKDIISRELRAIKDLQEERLRGANGEVEQVVEIGASGQVRMNREEGRSDAGRWEEFGPLFDGISWDEEKCSLVPTICKALRNDSSLCTVRGPAESSSQVWQLCGTHTVVTILRLRPGTTILPQCGTTNSRLIMHFVLEGAKDVELTVGGKTIKGYGEGDGHAIVFDDSFEHSVYHGGEQDIFVVLAVLAHPDLL